MKKCNMMVIVIYSKQIALNKYFNVNEKTMYMFDEFNDNFDFL